MTKRWIACAMLIMFATEPVLAEAWSRGCWQELTRHAMLRKYNYDYHWGCYDYTSKGKENFAAVTSKSTVESTTMGSDPGVTTGEGVSVTQFLSSFGPCSASKVDAADAARERFIAEMLPEIKEDIARGGGEYVAALGAYSHCLNDSEFGASLQDHYVALSALDNIHDSFAEALDTVIAGDPRIFALCRRDAQILAKFVSRR